MHRRYRPWHYAAQVAALVEAVGPELALGADVMVGFPGESEAEFRESYELIASLPFTYLHLFPFSPRPGTPGWELHRQSPVAGAAVAERMAALQALAAEKMRRFRLSLLGCTLPGITLNTPAVTAAQGRTSVLTDDYVPVEVAGVFAANLVVDLRLTSIDGAGAVLGEIKSSVGNIAVAS
jgi:threonylcarbamoyladenosine tRNA methylthiotransferase MtaB